MDSRFYYRAYIFIIGNHNYRNRSNQLKNTNLNPSPKLSLKPPYLPYTNDIKLNKTEE